MILDRLENAAKYTGFKFGISEAFGFLDHPGLSDLSDGRYEILGDRVFAIVSRAAETRPLEEGRLEAHRKYIDIHYLIAGEETLGWKSRVLLRSAQSYDPEEDVEFFDEPPDCLIRLIPGTFAVFLPSDAHQPLIGQGHVHKVVVKVAVN